MPTTPSPPVAEKRRAPRSRTIRRALCVFSNGTSTLDVTLRDMSPHGARLVAQTLVRLPPTFELRINDGFGGNSMRRVRLAWVKGETAGVEFID